MTNPNPNPPNPGAGTPPPSAPTPTPEPEPKGDVLVSTQWPTNEFRPFGDEDETVVGQTPQKMPRSLADKVKEKAKLCDVDLIVEEVPK